jgi:hypothetical protein
MEENATVHTANNSARSVAEVFGEWVEICGSLGPQI